ncbi:beta-ketoacyl synthase chain length factor [Photobacterium lipolyticum]|uniref:3-oxoacyl-ACP synthase n=1 Tax=Photobacterium lipolyticum TaxID=266810 RepID=A0A2T3N3C4_9GAMM|nr:beta-ketoacyl synthase chain length factor [Photobacterium lipolyticum]PSW06876.1 3-oxoacyl-ACP synthase [Photobacterium lipolyticum]
MNSVHFNIINWQALSPGLIDQAAWATWADNHQIWPETLVPVPSNLIPAVMRRRMSSLSKLAMQTAISLTQQIPDRDIDYIVFSSRHGELTRTVKLLQDILNGEDASPTAFSQSVHNTAAGLYTISTRKAIPVASIGAGENTLHSALIEAAAYLAEYPSHNVLVVDFDEPLPSPYLQFDVGHYQGYALGMVLTGGDAYQLSWEPGSNQTAVRPPQAPFSKEKLSKEQLPQSLDVIANLLSKNNTWSIAARRTHWHWKR